MLRRQSPDSDAPIHTIAIGASRAERFLVFQEQPARLGLSLGGERQIPGTSRVYDASRLFLHAQTAILRIVAKNLWQIHVS